MLEKGQISRGQLMSLVIGFLLGSSLILTPGNPAGQDAWAALGIGVTEGTLVSIVYCSLASRYPGKTVVEICHSVWGRIVGTVLAVAFLWYLLHLGSLVMGNFVDFTKTTLLPRTPSPILMALLLLPIIMAVGNGIEVLSRSAVILVPVVCIMILLVALLLLPDFDLSRFQPVLAKPPAKILYIGHTVSSFPFAESVAFLMVLPFLSGGAKPTTMVMPILIAGAVLFVVSLRNIGVMGSYGVAQVYPSYEAGRQIELAGFITRLESLPAVNFLATGFLKISVLVYGASLGTAQVLGLESYRSVVWPVALIMSALSAVNFANISENLELVTLGWPVYAPIFQILLPGLTLVVAIVRGLPKKEGDKKRSR